MNEKLNSRHQEEKEFHDKKIKGFKSEGQSSKNIYSIEGLSKAYGGLIQEAGSLKGLKVLEFGCGEGWASVDYNKKGADNVYAFDISFESLKSAKEYIVNKNANVHLIQMAGEYAGIKSESFDLILGNAILHHTDIPMVLTEIHRILKNNGRAIFVEPLDHNPVINLFRKLTPWRRSKFEQPINLTDLDISAGHFSSYKVKGYYLISVFAIGAFMVHGNKNIFYKTFNVLNAIDNFILDKFAFMNRYCFASVLVFNK